MLKKKWITNLEKTPSKPTSRELETNAAEKRVPKSKMYTDFFKRKTTRAATWRGLPPLSVEEMNLNQKADAVTEKIATDFINWLRNLGGEEEVSLSVPIMTEMFEIKTNSATSLKVNLKKLPLAPRRVAEAQNEPEGAKRSVQSKEIMKGARVNKKATTYTTSRSHNVSSAEARYRKWVISDPAHENLASMAAVWQGITHLKSTRAFCKFLIKNPEIKPPKYLRDLGMLNWKALKEKDERSSSDIS